MWTNQEVKERGKIAFMGNYWPCVGVAVVLGICSSGAGISYRSSNRTGGTSTMTEVLNSLDPQAIIKIMIATMVGIAFVVIVAMALKAFVFNPLAVSCYRFFVLNDGGKAEINELAYGFTSNYKNIVKVMFLKDLYISLWALLFIVPGIIKSYEYMMIPYLLAEDSSIPSNDCFEMSGIMMNGNKMNAFLLGLSFIGWIILVIFTFGILAVFYVNPYMYCTFAALYNRLKIQIIPAGVDNNSYDYQTY